MGEVYRGRDSRLERDVAVKVLPADVARDPDRLRRLEAEARAAGRINHPNVLAVYDVATIDGAPCIISELLEGETLRSKLSRGRMPAEQAIRYATQIAEGLAAAHRREIVHRDLKPENIFITTDGHAKILDFGLAKSLETAETDAVTAARMTRPGTVMGTVGYMSPEQVRGGPVDQRSDIFSFGVVLYEMLCGKRAFDRNSAAETMSAILSEEPQRCADQPISDAVVTLLRRCLAKDPDSRYASAHELAFQLEQLSAGRSATVRLAAAGSGKPLRLALTAAALVLAGAAFWYASREPRATTPGRTTSLAVLPFVNMSGDRNDEYFSDGMTEELINALAKVEGLHVAARTSSFAFKGKDTDVRAAGKKLGVEHLLEGSIRKTGNRLRVSAHLINGANGYSLWSETYDREMSDVFSVQRDIAQQIVARLTSRGTAAARPAASPSASELEAYDLYLKGNFVYNRSLNTLSREFMRQAIDFYEKALSKDRSLAAAHSALANAYTHLELFGDENVKENHRKAAASARKALELDPTLAEAHVALGEILFHHDGNAAAAEREFRRAIELNPNSAQAHLYYGWLLMANNRMGEALVENRRALQLDPLEQQAVHSVAAALIYLRRYDEAIPLTRDGLALAPDSAALWGQLGTAHSMTGRHDEAIRAYARSYALSPAPFMRGVQAWAYARAGRRAEALQILGEVLSYRPEERIQACHSIGGTYTALGEHDRAIEWLGKGVKAGTVDWFALSASPWFDPLRTDARFARLIEEAAAKENRKG